MNPLLEELLINLNVKVTTTTIWKGEVTVTTLILIYRRNL
jgi:hypothetical protein